MMVMERSKPAARRVPQVLLVLALVAGVALVLVDRPAPDKSGVEEVPVTPTTMYVDVDWRDTCDLCRFHRCASDSSFSCASGWGYADGSGSQGNFCMCACCRVQCGLPAGCPEMPYLTVTMTLDGDYSNLSSTNKYGIQKAIAETAKVPVEYVGVQFTNGSIDVLSIVTIPLGQTTNTMGTAQHALLKRNGAKLQANIDKNTDVSYPIEQNALSVLQLSGDSCQTNDGCPFNYRCAHGTCTENTCPPQLLRTRTPPSSPPCNGTITFTNGATVPLYGCPALAENAPPHYPAVDAGSPLNFCKKRSYFICSENWQCYSKNISFLGNCAKFPYEIAHSIPVLSSIPEPIFKDLGVCYLNNVPCSTQQRQGKCHFSKVRGVEPITYWEQFCVAPTTGTCQSVWEIANDKVSCGMQQRICNNILSGSIVKRVFGIDMLRCRGGFCQLPGVNGSVCESNADCLYPFRCKGPRGSRTCTARSGTASAGPSPLAALSDLSVTDMDASVASSIKTAFPSSDNISAIAAADFPYNQAECKEEFDDDGTRCANIPVTTSTG